VAGRSEHELADGRQALVLAGKYRLLSVLGQGGMGTVWRAEHLGLGAPVAVKLIDPKAAGGEETLRQCQKEARAAAALRSPHVVQVLDFGIDAATGSPFIVMELLEGENLAARLHLLGRLSPADTSRVLLHVARALGRAHEAGIVHRDLKPANVFLVRNEDEDVAKVLDFGTARVQRAGVLTGLTTPTGGVIGTPYYMSPEHISGQPVDHRTDLWAMAVMAFECLTGRRPFDAGDVGRLVLQICTYPIPVPSRLAPVPAGFDAWFERATRRPTDQRFASARELAGELRRICLGASPGALRPGSSAGVRPTLELERPAAPPGQRRRHAAWWLGAGAAVTAAVVLIGAATSPAGAPPAIPSAGAAPGSKPAAAPAPAPAVVAAPERLPLSTAVAGTPAPAPVSAETNPGRRRPRRRIAPATARAIVPAPPARAPDQRAALPRMESVLDHRR
jgi:eukaryotic-like serine/threonine-protein kinase